MIGYIILGIVVTLVLFEGWCIMRMGSICSREEEQRRPWPGELPEDEGEK
jgi:flagellar biogenesis protein FliO